MADKLTHIDADGRARMVDVSGKPPTRRVAMATGRCDACGGTVLSEAPATPVAVELS